jgi:CHAT domain-containing protein
VAAAEAFATRQEVTALHPGLLSGLALAGANRPPAPGEDDGILTALDVADLDLTSTDLVVLSACETALGQTAGGEGVLGLQRSFAVAGARSTITSLWKVDDAATQKLMERFYGNLLARRMGKLAALREAQLWMLSARTRDEAATRGITRERSDEDVRQDPSGRTPPYFWAAFVLGGDWR